MGRGGGGIARGGGTQPHQKRKKGIKKTEKPLAGVSLCPYRIFTTPVLAIFEGKGKSFRAVSSDKSALVTRELL